MKKSHKFSLVGNWKMNPASLRDAKQLRTRYRALEKKYPQIALAYAPPTAYLAALSPKSDESLQMVAQNIFYEQSGAYTGATSVQIAKSVGCSQVLIGHSERRTIFGVSEETVGKKVRAAIALDMPMIVCVGEDQRDESGAYIDALTKQLETVLEPFRDNKNKLKLLSIAYEPLWAVGEHSSRAVTADELFSTRLLIEQILAKYMSQARAKRITLLYGGSVNAGNVAALAQVPGIDGFLVGRASRDPKELADICNTLETL